jgi:thioredoxin
MSKFEALYLLKTKEQFLKRIADYEKNNDSFEFLGDKPALIDFFAGWCGPCKMLAPVLEEVSDEYAGRVDVYKVDVEQEEELAALFSVRSIPTLVFIPLNGQIRITQGAVGKPQLKEAIDNILLK